MFNLNVKKVTPFVGVWIETNLRSAFALDKLVTPFVGVWIETLYFLDLLRSIHVTPFVGVWIETPEHRVVET